MSRARAYAVPVQSGHSCKRPFTDDMRVCTEARWMFAVSAARRYLTRMPHPIQERLRSLGKSQTGLAQLWGVDPSQLTRFFRRNQTMDIFRYVAMADYAEMPLADVLELCGVNPSTVAAFRRAKVETDPLESALIATLGMIEGLQNLSVALHACLDTVRRQKQERGQPS